MHNAIPDEIILNGVNASENSANRGKYLLTLTAADLERMALGQRYNKRHLEDLRQRDPDSGLEQLKSGLDQNNLAQAGWGVIFPADGRSAADPVRDALGELLAWRKEQAGDLFKLYEGAAGYQPRETASTFMSRHGASPGTVNPVYLPYYLLLVGDVDEIPYRFQYELDATYLVGRLYFDTPEEYARYARSVVEAEKGALRLPPRAVFFGTRHAGDRATELSSRMLVDPLAAALGREKPHDWKIERVPAADCTKDNLSRLLGGGDAPALLFTAGHGVGFDNGHKMQLPFQGGLLCQDLEAIDETISRRHYVGAEDIDDNYQLRGLVNFHFACYGLGTPRRDSFTRPDRQTPQTIAPRDFLAALPRRLLGHPNGGALAVIGHVDRAWTYSFRWGEADAQTGTFQDTLLRLMAGDRIGVALDQFNVRYAQIAVQLTTMLDHTEEPPDPAVLAGLWTANNDARGYALLGDPAVALPVARTGETAAERPNATPIVVTLPLPSMPVTRSEPAMPPPPGAAATDDAALRRQLRTHLKSLAAQLDSFADDVAPPVAAEVFAAEDFDLFNRGKLDELTQKMRDALEAIGKHVAKFAEDVTSLEVRTYTSENIEREEWEDEKGFTTATQRARTHIKLDGDTDIVVPIEAGELDEVIWDIHSRAVEQAQANRVAMLKAVGELVTALIPTGK